MVRTAWVETLHGGPVLYPAYRSHRADNELTVIARATDQFVYAPDCVLTPVRCQEGVPDRAYRNRQFSPRTTSACSPNASTIAVDAPAPQPERETMRDDYRNQRKPAMAEVK